MSIYDKLAGEWHDDEPRIRDWFTRHHHHNTYTARHGDNITTEPSEPCPLKENPVSVPDAVAALKTNLQTLAAAAVTVTDTINATLTDDVPGLENIGQQIDNSRLIQAAVAADAVVPQAVLDAEAATLEALAGAFTPAPVPAPVAVDQPAA